MTTLKPGTLMAWALALTVSLCAPTLSSQSFDTFLYDDFSLDPESMGYKVVAPPATVQSRVSQRLSGSAAQPVADVISRLETRVNHPATETLVLTLDAEADIIWKTGDHAPPERHDRFSGRFNQATAAYTAPDRFMEAGWQSLRWGTIHGAGVLDVVSPDRTGSRPHLAGEKLPQLSLQAAISQSDQELVFFVTPWPTGESAGAELTAASTDVDRDATPEFGLRYEMQTDNAELAGYVATLTPDRVAFASIEPQADPEPYSLVGFSAQYGFQTLSIQAEVAYKHGVTATQDSPEPLRTGAVGDRLESAVGFHLARPTAGEWTAFVTLGHWLNGSGLTDGQATSSRLGLSWRQDYLDERLLLAGATEIALTGPFFRVTGNAGYNLQNGWLLELELTHIAALEESRFADLMEPTEYQVGLSYGF